MNGKSSSNKIDQSTLNHFEGISEWMIHSIWRLEMSKDETMDEIILIFEMTLQLTIARESFDIKNAREYTGHRNNF